ncbi:hypothetical protein SAMN05660766_3410 [Curtobacterium sp. 314Chir4.1]|uniref:hypothetical protein n=1 Tax=Curtobacterium sp. 314Chir4.1 TaxID=1279028 RepID=UPI000BD2E6ED|nr:hypothetical protein [Curtobacterium sp. 314Chir4.1]SOC89678.1 hypothetical protein SAMN05660766_3410 [Curtobacterium sp. 314Chir4.1]
MMQEDELGRLITVERLRSYTERTGSSADALRLYEWNMRAAASVMELTGVVEVMARNALDRELREWTAKRTGAPWFDVAPLDGRGRADLVKARARASRDGRRDEVHGRVIAELTFGFWRYLVETRYLTALWTPALHKAFPHGPADSLTRQREVRRRLQQLHFVRNRAAHHEPIHTRDLQRDHDYALELVGWISPHAALWAADTTSLRAVLRARPDG